MRSRASADHSGTAAPPPLPRKRYLSLQERAQNRQTIQHHLMLWHQQRSHSNPGTERDPRPSGTRRDADRRTSQELPSSAAPQMTSSRSVTSLPGVQQESASFRRPPSLSEAGGAVALGAEEDASPNGGDSDNHIAAMPDPEDGVNPSLLEAADVPLPRRVPQRSGAGGSDNEEVDEVWELRQLSAAGALALALDVADVIEAGDGAVAAAAAGDADATNTSSLPNRAILRGRSSK